MSEKSKITVTETLTGEKVKLGFQVEVDSFEHMFAKRCVSEGIIEPLDVALAGFLETYFNRPMELLRKISTNEPVQKRAYKVTAKAPGKKAASKKAKSSSPFTDDPPATPSTSKLE